MSRIRLTFFLCVLFVSCTEDEGPVIEPIEEKPYVLILNEGNFQSANGSITLYYPDENRTVEKVFQANNNGRPLGDVVQSMIQIGDRYYIVVNNSNKIEVVASNNFKSIGKIDALNSPRYLLPISETKMYVSDLYEDYIYVVNPQTLSVEKKIETKGWVEEMRLINGEAFVCHVDSGQVWVFDAQTDTLKAKITTNLQPQHLEVDLNQQLWVSCSGGINDSFPALIQIDPLQQRVIKKLEVPDKSKSIGELAINKEGTSLLYLMEDLFEISIDATNLATVPKIASNSRLFYGLGVSHQNEIYLSDAIDYLQKGVIYRYAWNGEEMTTFRAGIIPGEFFFKQ